MEGDKSNPQESTVGVAWYRREQWPHLLEISTDRSDLEDSYDDWLLYITRAFETMRNEGLDPVKVDVDTEELLVWCTKRNLPVDAKTRARYVTEKVQKVSQPPLH